MTQDSISPCKGIVTDKLHYYLGKYKIASIKLLKAVECSFLPGGKFMKSSFLLDFCFLCSGKIDVSLPLACAAVVAQDVLFSLAAEILTEKATVDLLGNSACVKARNILFNNFNRHSTSCMVDGQAFYIFFTC